MPRGLVLNAERGTQAAGARRRRPTLLCLSHLRWEFVYQRPQHLMSRAAQAYEVYFFEEPIFEAGGSPRLVVTRHPSNVTVAVPVLRAGCSPRQWARSQRRLLDGLLAAVAPDRVLAWYYTPFALTFSCHIASALCVYDNLAEPAGFLGAPPELAVLERELLLKADIVFTGGQSLYDAKLRRHRNIHLFPSSVDASHFGQARLSMPEPSDQSAIMRPRL